MPKTISSVAKNYSVLNNYDLKPENLDKVIEILEWSTTALARPTACHFCIHLTSECFNITKMTNTIKSVCRSTGYALAWSLEHAISPKTTGTGYHIHVMVIFNTTNKKPMTIADTIQRKLQELEHVDSTTTDSVTSKSVKLFKRKCPVTGLETKDYFHNLNSELYDAVYRYSYFAKQEDKAGISRPRKFDTSKAMPRKAAV
jgi:hypothetical protein